MPAELDHIIVHATDPRRSAALLAAVLGAPVLSDWGPFVRVQTANRVTVDYMLDDPPFTKQHCAFLVDDATFDAAHRHLVDQHIHTYADPWRRQPGEINHLYGGRGVYFDDPDGHLMELITAPKATGPKAPTPAEPMRRLSRRWRHALLVLHIAASVAILGDSAAFLAIALRARGLNAVDAHASYEILGMLSLTFGIPLNFVALATGVALGLGTQWGVFRYPWVITKLALLVSVMAVGGFVLGPAEDSVLAGTGGTGALVAGATWDVLALLAAMSLSVFKPGRALRPHRTATTRRSAAPGVQPT